MLYGSNIVHAVNEMVLFIKKGLLYNSQGQL